ncbi:MAG: S8 family serine peptidase, partial [Pseudomonadota bacterium]|nr:S8 family serine peptidase [Pseudomonadota bacterium]
PLASAVRYQEPRLYVPGELLVQYRSGTEATLAKSSQLKLGLEKKRDLRDGRTQLLKLPAISDMRSMMALLRADPAVAFAEPNYIRHTRARRNPTDPLFDRQWGLRSTGQANFVPTEPGEPDFASVPGADMNMLVAWDADADGTFERVGSRDVVIAVIDDAFDLTHPDLIDNFVPGRDLVNDDDDPSYDNTKLDHGTLVAGSLGATGDNTIGIAGIVWNASMMPLRIGELNDDGEAELSSAAIIDAYDYARENGAQIINASYGGPSFLNSELQALTRLRDAGILFVTSAGNFNSNLDYSIAAYPANYDLPNIVSVAATNRQDNIASFSQYGPLSTDVAAPGLQIITTRIGGSYLSGQNCGEGGDCGVSGTSFAAPHVAGVAALLKAEYPDADYRELKARLIEGAEDGVDGGDAEELSAGGRVDAARSLAISPRPSLILNKVRLIDDGNERLDPGETLEIEVTIENLWLAATGVQAQLVVPSVISIVDGSAAVDSIATGGTATVRFTIQVGTPTAVYSDLPFAVSLSANGGGYQARRPFQLELATLDVGEIVDETLSTGLHDEFHTYHVNIDSPPRAGERLVIRTNTDDDEDIDVDLLVKYDQPAEYDIDLGAEEDEFPTFYVDEEAEVSADEGGDETVSITNPKVGTYYITVVNYGLTESLDYSLSADFEEENNGGGGGGGGPFSPYAAAVLLCAAIWRRRRQ